MENCHVLDAYCINVHACNELVCPKGWKIPAMEAYTLG